MQVGRPWVMGILNVTPDSFSDGGRHPHASSAVAHGRRMAAEGARWIDVGGESTRPGAEPVPEDEERRRVVPVVEALAADGLDVSVDTRKPGVARAAVAAGARMVNDVSARLGPLAGELGVAYAAMHMQGEPRTMQRAPTYEDVVAEVRAQLVAVATEARAAGCPEVWIDPGFGFGKSLEHNLALLGRLEALVETGFPVLVGTSRKTTLGRLAARADGAGEPTPPGDRLAGSLATAAWAFDHGAGMVRAHDVAATAQVALAVAAATAAA